MNGPELDRIIRRSGASLRDLAALLGYRSENSLRQVLEGRAVLPDARAAWLRMYADMRESAHKAEREWLRKHPAPKV